MNKERFDLIYYNGIKIDGFINMIYGRVADNIWQEGIIVYNVKNNNLCQIVSDIKYIDVNNKCWFWVDDLVSGTTYYISERHCIKYCN